MILTPSWTMSYVQASYHQLMVSMAMVHFLILVHHLFAPISSMQEIVACVAYDGMDNMCVLRRSNF